MSDWASLIAQVAESKAEKVPEGFQTREQISKELGLSGSHTREILHRLVSGNRVERRDFSVVVNGQLRKVPHYRRV